MTDLLDQVGSAPEPRRLWCRCHHHTAWRTSRGWVLRYRCATGAWGGGGGNGASLEEAYRWCASCAKCLAASKRTFPIVVDTWTEYERGWGSRPDGLSMHLNTADHKAFVADFNKKHNNLPSAPDEYTTADNSPRVVDVPESLYQRLVDLKAEGKLGLFAESLEGAAQLAQQGQTGQAPPTKEKP